jgi:ferric iron reductase protein FhuF
VDLLREISETGPFFEVTGGPLDESWRPLRDLLQPEVLRGQVDALRRSLAARHGVELDEIDARAAASLHFLAVAARLVSPVLAGIARHGVTLDTDLGLGWWRPGTDGPIPLGWAPVHPVAVTSAAEAATLIERGLLGRVVAPLADVVAATFGVSPHVIRGNVASALNGAAIVLGASRRTLVIRPEAVVATLLTRGWLVGAGRYTTEGRFFRNNCCLYYRVPGGGPCADCVLVAGRTGVGR